MITISILSVEEGSDEKEYVVLSKSLIPSPDKTKTNQKHCILQNKYYRIHSSKKGKQYFGSNV